MTIVVSSAGVVWSSPGGGWVRRQMMRWSIRGDVGHLEQVRTWFGRPLWEMEPADADANFGRVLRETAKGTRLGRAQALKTYFLFLELRHKVEIHNLTGRVVECPIDELNRRRGGAEAMLRIPPTDAEIAVLFGG